MLYLQIDRHSALARIDYPISFFKSSVSLICVVLLIIAAPCAAETSQGPGKSTSENRPALSFGPEISTQQNCLKCHNYSENHHPVDFVPPGPDDYVFPLFNNEIKCLTCHTEDHQMGSSKLLRGGPYAEIRGFCFKCHYRERYAEIDPHVMLDKNGKALEVNGNPVCLICHSVKPDPATDRAGDVRFRADIAFLCWRCHPSMVNPIFDKHFLAKPSAKILRHMEVMQQKMLITIPLIPRERITCSTCHNPHQKGVITFEPSAKGADSPSRLRLQAPSLCLACHEM